MKSWWCVIHSRLLRPRDTRSSTARPGCLWRASRICSYASHMTTLTNSRLYWKCAIPPAKMSSAFLSKLHLGVLHIRYCLCFWNLVTPCMFASVSLAGDKPSSVTTVTPDPSLHCMLTIQSVVYFQHPSGRIGLDAPLCAALVCVRTLYNRLMAIFSSGTVFIFALSLLVTHHTVNSRTTTQMHWCLLFLSLMIPVTRMLYQCRGATSGSFRGGEILMKFHSMTSSRLFSRGTTFRKRSHITTMYFCPQIRIP